MDLWCVICSPLIFLSTEATASFGTCNSFLLLDTTSDSQLILYQCFLLSVDIPHVGRRGGYWGGHFFQNISISHPHQVTRHTVSSSFVINQTAITYNVDHLFIILITLGILKTTIIPMWRERWRWQANSTWPVYIRVHVCLQDILVVDNITAPYTWHLENHHHPSVKGEVEMASQQHLTCVYSSACLSPGHPSCG